MNPARNIQNQPSNVHCVSIKYQLLQAIDSRDDNFIVQQINTLTQILNKNDAYEVCHRAIEKNCREKTFVQLLEKTPELFLTITQVKNLIDLFCNIHYDKLVLFHENDQHPMQLIFNAILRRCDPVDISNHFVTLCGLIPDKMVKHVKEKYDISDQYWEDEWKGFVDNNIESSTVWSYFCKEMLSIVSKLDNFTISAQTLKYFILFPVNNEEAKNSLLKKIDKDLITKNIIKLCIKNQPRLIPYFLTINPQFVADKELIDYAIQTNADTLTSLANVLHKDIRNLEFVKYVHEKIKNKIIVIPSFLRILEPIDHEILTYIFNFTFLFDIHLNDVITQLFKTKSQETNVCQALLLFGQFQKFWGGQYSEIHFKNEIVPMLNELLKTNKSELIENSDRLLHLANMHKAHQKVILFLQHVCSKAYPN